MEPSESFQTLSPESSNLNPQTISLENAEKTPKVEEVVFQYLPYVLRNQMLKGLEEYPDSLRPKNISIIPPSYHAVVVSPKEAPMKVSSAESQSKMGVFFLSGSPGTAAQISGICTELFNNVSKRLPEDTAVNVVAGIDSSINMDKEDNRVPLNPVERAAYQAGLIMELMKKHKCDSLYLMGHSLGGMELGYMIPMLKSLLKQNKFPESAIKGLTFFQSAALYEQNSLNFMTVKTAKINDPEQIVKEIYPTLEDVANLETEIWRAQEAGDMGLVIRKTDQLSKVKELRGNPPYLTYDQKEQLSVIDQEIASAIGVDQKKYDHLLKKRTHFLLHQLKVIKQASSGGDKRSKFDPPFSMWLKLGSSNIANMHIPRVSFSGLTETLPDSIRQSITYPVSLAFTDEDHYFNRREAESRMLDMQIKKYNQAPEGQDAYHHASLFPKASILRHLYIENFSHCSPVVRAEKFAAINADALVATLQNKDKVGIENRYYS
jgi:hypothetical protein